MKAKILPPPALGLVQQALAIDPIFELLQQYRADKRSDKQDFGIGVYKDHLNRATVFKSVKAAEQWRIDTEQDKAYSGPLGNQQFCQLLSQLILGQALNKQLADNLVLAQTPGGVGALRLAFDMVKHSPRSQNLWLSNNTWQVHHPIAIASGLNRQQYAYCDGQNRLCFEALLHSLNAAQCGDAVLIQASCHNPTGLDLNRQQWRRLSELCLRKQLLPIIDMAYHGLGEGLNADALGVRRLAADLPEFILCYTCSKNFGLYSDRAGMLMVKTRSKKARSSLSQQLMQLATCYYFTPPAHGASLVKYILSRDLLRRQWQQELNVICDRLQGLRQQLFQALVRAAPQRDWRFLTNGSGMFGLFPLNPQEIQQLRQRYGIYMVANGRVNLSGFNPTNISTVTRAIADIANASRPCLSC